MKPKLFAEAIGKFVCGVVLVGILLFLPAGTLRWSRGWLLMGILFLPMFAAGLVMLKKNPTLLTRRLQAKESKTDQQLLIRLSGLMFILAFVSAGLSFRFGWLLLPDWVSYAAAAVFLIAYLLYAEVLRENTWLSRTIEVQEKQTVVDTGLYGIVRHPMYSVTLLLFLSMPLVLGSVTGFVFLLFYPFLIVRRIRGEEQLLETELNGYAAYKQKVKYRLIPFIW